MVSVDHPKKKMPSADLLGILGKAFQFTHDDLAANRAGFMTYAQQMQLGSSWSRRLVGSLLTAGLGRFLLGRPRPVQKLTGNVYKIQNTRTVVKWLGGGDDGGGTNYNDIAHHYTIQITAEDGSTESFYVTSSQFHAVPNRATITLYYDPLDERIVSVEPPYDLNA